jgi:hypothetical protein
MAETAGADTVLDVKDEIVAGPGRYPHRDGIELESATSFPRHDVIGAGCIRTWKVFTALRYQPYLNQVICVIQIERIVVVVLLDKRAAPRLGTALFTLQAEDPKFEANLF